VNFDPGIAIEPNQSPLGFRYGTGIFGPPVEYRRLDAIRASLFDPRCCGPDTVYAIAMDIGKICHRESLQDHHLLFGAVTYASGCLGRELVRSQGHVHAASARSGVSTPELMEIWTGQAIVYLQEYIADDPGRCIAIFAREGDVVVIPPAWAHQVISANPNENLTFGAWCVRDYRFEYTEVRSRHGLAWYPLLSEDAVCWQANPMYQTSLLQFCGARLYPELELSGSRPIYAEFERSPEGLSWISDPQPGSEFWEQVVCASIREIKTH
jgi:glucose-6-phosphate isomerase, archaeal